MGLIFKSKRQVRPAFIVVLGLVLVLGGCLAVGSAVVGINDGRDQEAREVLERNGVAIPNQTRPNSPTWTGTLRVTDQGTDMGLTTPATDTVGGKATVVYDGQRGTLSTENAYPAGLWTSTADPSYEQCLTLLQTQALSRDEARAVPYRRGQGLCIVTFNEAAVVFVRGESPAGSEAVQMRGVRWPNGSR